MPAKIEIRASRNRGERMDVISGTVFDKHGNTASFVIRSWRLDEIDFYVSRDTLVRVVYDLSAKILKKYAKIVSGPVITGESPPGIYNYSHEIKWIHSKWLVKLETLPKEPKKRVEEVEKVARKVMDEIWKLSSENENNI